ncbi:putative transporter [Tolypocladium ophioglossoides CBS 100239]|uniref:Putative transporter n=1 Tax=Tolypocladium ophioglossoides (strain CBS 100239) TaxID=1163406 RepID=A0A0L0N1M7_TOLOC|nr:putative transporter [Tolypocladium ophioglossoides CBS 100239]
MPTKIGTEVNEAERRSTSPKRTAGVIPGADDAQTQLFLHFASRDEEWRAVHEKKLVRRIDLHLMPFLVIMYLLNFLDRSNLAQARQGGLEKDLGMSGTDFNLATSIFFVGYILMQLPSNMLITRVRPSLYLATSVLLWGIMSTCNATAYNFAQLVVTRFILGFVEAPFFPGAVFLMSSWYTRAELTRRIAWFFCGNALANMFGGLIAYGVLKDLDGASGIAGWRWLFIIEGGTTIGVSFVAAFFLPDYPATTRWLSDEERAFAAWRLLIDISEADERSNTSIWNGIKLALLDYRLYLFILLTHMSILAMTFQYFFPSIVQTLAWFATFIVAVLVNWTAARYDDRSIHIFCLMLLATAGNVIATVSTSTGARFFAMFLMPVGAVSTYTLIVGWVANSFPRPLVKRSAVIAIANMIGNTASIYGSYMYNEKTRPQYVPGGSSNAVIGFLVGVLAIALRHLHKWENKKLEEAEGEAAAEGGGAAEQGPDRLVGFRYIY